MEGFSTLDKRSDRIVLEANTDYWDRQRFPRLQRVVFDNTLGQAEALGLVKTGTGRVDLVSELRPVETLRVAESPFAKVVKNRGALVTVFGQFNMRKAQSPWHDVRLRQTVNLAVNRDELICDVKGNGVIIPALVPERAFGYDPTLAPYSFDWVVEQPELRQLYEQALHAVDAEQQQRLIRQMERHTHEQAYFLFLYNPIQLYAVNKAVEFVPHVTTLLGLAETAVTEAHWSVQQAAVPQAPSGTPPLWADPSNAAQVSVGQTVYAQHCATCHGANLEGQPNWQKRLPSGNSPAPPHDETGHTWHHPDQYLFKTTKYGWQRFAPPGYQSAMQGFQDVLSDAEIWAVLAFIKSHWPPSIRAQQERLNARGQ